MKVEQKLALINSINEIKRSYGVVEGIVSSDKFEALNDEIGLLIDNQKKILKSCEFLTGIWDCIHVESDSPRINEDNPNNSGSYWLGNPTDEC